MFMQHCYFLLFWLMRCRVIHDSVFSSSYMIIPWLWVTCLYVYWHDFEDTFSMPADTWLWGYFLHVSWHDFEEHFSMPTDTWLWGTFFHACWHMTLTNIFPCLLTWHCVSSFLAAKMLYIVTNICNMYSWPQRSCLLRQYGLVKEVHV